MPVTWLYLLQRSVPVTRKVYLLQGDEGRLIFGLYISGVLVARSVALLVKIDGRFVKFAGIVVFSVFHLLYLQEWRSISGGRPSFFSSRACAPTSSFAALCSSMVTIGAESCVPLIMDVGGKVPGWVVSKELLPSTRFVVVGPGLPVIRILSQLLDRILLSPRTARRVGVEEIHGSGHIFSPS